jgi:hypothetical protein
MKDDVKEALEILNDMAIGEYGFVDQRIKNAVQKVKEAISSYSLRDGFILAKEESIPEILLGLKRIELEIPGIFSFDAVFHGDRNQVVGNVICFVYNPEYSASISLIENLAKKYDAKVLSANASSSEKS